jgi:translation initiation factor IF-3
VYPFEQTRCAWPRTWVWTWWRSAPSAVPPVCRITDYKKFLYDLKKKQKEIKAKQAVVEMKEIRFGPNTDEHDRELQARSTPASSWRRATR